MQPSPYTTKEKGNYGQDRRGILVTFHLRLPSEICNGFLAKSKFPVEKEKHDKTYQIFCN